MVVFVDLEDEAEPPELKIDGRWPATSTDTSKSASGFEAAGNELDEEGDARDGEEEGRENPNRNRMTEAFGSYPWVSNIEYTIIVHQY